MRRGAIPADERADGGGGVSLRQLPPPVGQRLSVNVVVRDDAMHVSGDLTTWEDSDTESGQPVLRQFCATCGSPIRSLSAASPKVAIVKAGTADDPGQFIPAIHVWTSSALPWVEIPAGLPRFPRNPG